MKVGVERDWPGEINIVNMDDTSYEGDDISIKDGYINVEETLYSGAQKDLKLKHLIAFSPHAPSYKPFIVRPKTISLRKENSNREIEKMYKVKNREFSRNQEIIK